MLPGISYGEGARSPARDYPAAPPAAPSERAARSSACRSCLVSPFDESTHCPTNASQTALRGALPRGRLYRVQGPLRLGSERPLDRHPLLTNAAARADRSAADTRDAAYAEAEVEAEEPIWWTD
eukprot:scaffold11516_cov63-Phaeocystis_antarctica.AAC.2